MSVATQNQVAANSKGKLRFTKTEQSLIRILHGGDEREPGTLTVEEIATLMGPTRDDKERDPQSVSSQISALKRKMKENGLDFHNFAKRDLSPKQGERGRAATGIIAEDMEAELAKLVG